MTLTCLRGLAACALTATALAIGGAVPTAASADSIVTFTDPTTGCTHEVYGPNFIIQSPPPTFAIVEQGGFGESVHCP